MEAAEVVGPVEQSTATFSLLMFAAAAVRRRLRHAECCCTACVARCRREAHGRGTRARRGALASQRRSQMPVAARMRARLTDRAGPFVACLGQLTISRGPTASRPGSMPAAAPAFGAAACAARLYSLFLISRCCSLRECVRECDCTHTKLSSHYRHQAISARRRAVLLWRARRCCGARARALSQTIKPRPH